MGGCKNGISYSTMYQNVTEGNFMFFDENFKNLSDLYYLEPGLDPSIRDMVEANTLNQEINNHRERCTTVKVSPRTKKEEICLANEGLGAAFFKTDLGHIFSSDLGDECGKMLWGKGPHKPEFAYDFVRVHSLMKHRSD